jgi:polar amino acid transport system substrate-binding protein
MRRRMVLAGGASALAFTARAEPPPASAVSDLAPGGKLRASINFGNAVLAQRDAAGTLTGISVDIARELGRRLGVPVELVPFEAAGKVSAAASSGAWDVAFLAIDPERAKEISFTDAYVVIEGAYLVQKASPLQTVDAVDQEGLRIAVAKGSAYDLFLSRALKHATLERAANTPAAADYFLARHLDVLAGVRQALEQTASGNPGLRLIPGRFMEIRQAMGVPAGRAAGATYLRAFVEDLKASGFVAAALKRNGQTDAAVAPPT